MSEQLKPQTLDNIIIYKTLVELGTYIKHAYPYANIKVSYFQYTRRILDFCKSPKSTLLYYLVNFLPNVSILGKLALCKLKV